MNCLRKPNRPLPTGAKNDEGRPQGQPSSEHCSAEACDQTSHLALARLLFIWRSWRIGSLPSGARHSHHDDPANQPKEEEARGGEDLKINDAGKRCEE
jgi:hypothetical protein